MRGSFLAKVAGMLALGFMSAQQGFAIRDKVIGRAKNGAGRRTGIAAARRAAKKRRTARARASKRKA